MQAIHMRINKPLPWGAGLSVLAASALALFLGLATAVLPAQLIALVIIVFIATPVLVWRPAWLIAPVIAIQMYLPSQPMADVITGVFLARCFLLIPARWPDVAAALKSPAMRPVYAILLTVLVSSVVALTVLGHSRKLVYGDLRIFAYWFWIVPFLVLAPSDKRARWVTRQLLIMGLLVSVLAIVQGASGLSLVSTGRVGQLETLSRADADITRVQIAGFVFVTFGLLLSMAQLVASGTSRRWLQAMLVAIFVTALIYNFGRAVWFWSLAGAVVVALALGWRAFVKFVVFALIASAVVGAGLATFKPRLLETMAERVASVFQEGSTRSSLGWRKIENALAIQKLGQTRLLGVGLGGEYRNAEPGLRQFENHTSYIHNGHLSLMLRLSVLGYLAYVALFFAIAGRAWRARKQPGLSAPAAASLAWLLIFAGQNLTQPDVMTAHGVTLLAALLVAWLPRPAPAGQA